MTSPATARRLWALGEPLHALIYFADECAQAGEKAGLRGFWQTYFALRAAPLGPVGPEVVTATFYNFAPGFVARRVPAVWDAVTPSDALAARFDGVDAAIRRVVGDARVSRDMVEAADLASTAAAAVDLPGRPLAAANSAVAPPDEPHLRLWQALTTLREHRGDGHVIALAQREIDGVAAHVLAAAAGRSGREWLQKARGWDDAAWDGAAAELTDRGWLADGELSAEGLPMVAAVEADTDRLALGPWRGRGAGGWGRGGRGVGPARPGAGAGG